MKRSSTMCILAALFIALSCSATAKSQDGTGSAIFSLEIDFGYEPSDDPFAPRRVLGGLGTFVEPGRLTVTRPDDSGFFVERGQTTSHDVWAEDNMENEVDPYSSPDAICLKSRTVCKQKEFWARLLPQRLFGAPPILHRIQVTGREVILDEFSYHTKNINGQWQLDEKEVFFNFSPIVSWQVMVGNMQVSDGWKLRSNQFKVKADGISSPAAKGYGIAIVDNLYPPGSKHPSSAYPLEELRYSFEFDDYGGMSVYKGFAIRIILHAT